MWNISVFLPRIDPYWGFFHSCMMNRANSSFNDLFLSNSVPLCRWAWSGPVMMNVWDVVERCRYCSVSLIDGVWYLSSTSRTCSPWLKNNFGQKIPGHGCICGLAVLQHGFMEDDATISDCGCYWGKTGIHENNFLPSLKCFCESCLLCLQRSPITLGKRKGHFSDGVVKNV